MLRWIAGGVSPCRSSPARSGWSSPGSCCDATSLHLRQQFMLGKRSPSQRLLLPDRRRARSGRSSSSSVLHADGTLSISAISAGEGSDVAAVGEVVGVVVDRRKRHGMASISISLRRKYDAIRRAHPGSGGGFPARKFLDQVVEGICRKVLRRKIFARLRKRCGWLDFHWHTSAARAPISRSPVVDTRPRP